MSRPPASHKFAADLFSEFFRPLESTVSIAQNDSVALTERVNGISGDDRNVALTPGQIGQVIEARGADAVVVQFADTAGDVYALASVPRHKLLRLHHGDRGEVPAWKDCPSAIPLENLAGSPDGRR